MLIFILKYQTPANCNMFLRIEIWTALYNVGRNLRNQATINQWHFWIHLKPKVTIYSSASIRMSDVSIVWSRTGDDHRCWTNMLVMIMRWTYMCSIHFMYVYPFHIHAYAVLFCRHSFTFTRSSSSQAYTHPAICDICDIAFQWTVSNLWANFLSH